MGTCTSATDGGTLGGIGAAAFSFISREPYIENVHLVNKAAIFIKGYKTYKQYIEGISNHDEQLPSTLSSTDLWQQCNEVSSHTMMKHPAIASLVKKYKLLAGRTIVITPRDLPTVGGGAIWAICFVRISSSRESVLVFLGIPLLRPSRNLLTLLIWTAFVVGCVAPFWTHFLSSYL